MQPPSTATHLFSTIQSYTLPFRVSRGYIAIGEGEGMQYSSSTIERWEPKAKKRFRVVWVSYKRVSLSIINFSNFRGEGGEHAPSGEVVYTTCQTISRPLGLPHLYCYTFLPLWCTISTKVRIVVALALFLVCLDKLHSYSLLREKSTGYNKVP